MKSICALIILISISSGIKIYAQDGYFEKNDHDELPYYFGISFGYNSSFLKTTKSGLFNEQSNFKRAESGSSGGIELGLMGTLKLARHWELRTVPKLIIGGSKYLNYYYADGAIPTDKSNLLVSSSGDYYEQMKLPQTLISIPLHVKFTSDRINNYRAYLFGGPKVDFNLSSNSQEYTAERDLGNATAPLMRKVSFGGEMGAGVHIYLPFAVISPEFRFSSSFMNDHRRDFSNPYSGDTFNKLQQRMLSFSINIEQ
ncbi:type IX secretion/gliding motility protein PorT/SprT [Rhizosphaericola mali]|nr:porin family protein [Rhizosphaericola mali]